MNAAPSRSSPNSARWMPAIAAAALLGTVVVAGVAGGSDGHSAAATTVSAVEAPVDTESTLSVPETTEPAPVETVPDVEKVPLDRTLGNGMVGDDVQRVQERLHELGFRPGPFDGEFGSLTRQAVWAFEKTVLQVPREQATGQVTPEMWDRMQDRVKVAPRRPQAGTEYWLEIDLPQQVAAVFHEGEAVFIAHSSHGTGEEWCREVTISPGEYGNFDGDEPIKDGRCGVSWTPAGVYEVDRKVEGRRQSALGGMLNPVYFNYGIAIHGGEQVPNQPASHGCVRIANPLSEELFGLLSYGDKVFVFDGVKEPEEYGDPAPPPRFDTRWDEWYETSTTEPEEDEDDPETTVPEGEETETTLVDDTVPETTVDTTTPPTTTTTTPTTTTTTSLPQDEDPGDGADEDDGEDAADPGDGPDPSDGVEALQPE